MGPTRKQVAVGNLWASDTLDEACSDESARMMLAVIARMQLSNPLAWRRGGVHQTPGFRVDSRAQELERRKSLGIGQAGAAAKAKTPARERRAEKLTAVHCQSGRDVVRDMALPLGRLIRARQCHMRRSLESKVDKAAADPTADTESPYRTEEAHAFHRDMCLIVRPRDHAAVAHAVGSTPPDHTRTAHVDGRYEVRRARAAEK